MPLKYLEMSICLHFIIFFSFHSSSSFFFFFFWLIESQFPNQGLNPGHGGESPESEPPGHQGAPCFR